MEPYLTGSALITKDEWKHFLNGVRAVLPGEENFNKQITTLVASIEKAVLTRAKECSGDIGLLFSGGVDSTLIAHILKKNNILFTAVTVGFQDEGTKEPEDIIESKKAAEELGLTQTIKILNLDEAEKVFEKTKELLGVELCTPISLGVGSVVVAAAQTTPEIKHWFGGLGSEELFAGYQRHDEAEDLQEECWRGLEGMYERDLLRDYALGTGLSIAVHTPFLDERVIALSMEIPDTEKIKEHEGIMQKKYCLRAAAQQMGLDKEFAWRPKRAAQYGSRTDSALDKLAKKKGMTKKEYCTK